MSRSATRSGNLYRGDRVEVTGGMKHAFVDSLTLTTNDGALITADDVDYASELETILTNAHYSPCGLCIDDKGRRIGWKVNALEDDLRPRRRALVYLEGADARNPRHTDGLDAVACAARPQPAARRRASACRATTSRARFGAPARRAFLRPGIGDDIDLLADADADDPAGLPDGAPNGRTGSAMARSDVKASRPLPARSVGLHAGTVGDTDWRGAVQTTGSFTPLEDWTVGWSYTAFTDAGYLVDYSAADLEESSSTRSMRPT